MFNNQSVSLVLPCRDEEKALLVLLASIPKEVDEIIVVDNRSIDQTPKVAQRLKVKVFSEQRSENGIGYGFALAKGIKSASGDVIVCMDGDGSYPVSEVPRLVTILRQKNLDFISCARFPFQGPKQMSTIRTFGVQIINLLVCILFGYQIQDSLSGMWVFRRKIIHDLSRREGGWNFSLEIKLSAMSNHKIKFAEYNIPYHDRVFGSSKQNILKTGIEHLIYLFYFKLRLLRN